MLFAGSETGMIELNEKKILSKGRLGPGEIIGVRIEKGKVFFNADIKDYLAKEFKHFNSQIVDLDEKLPISNEKNNFEGEDLRRRQYTFGISLEDLELILHPMAEDAKEAILQIHLLIQESSLQPVLVLKVKMKFYLSLLC